MRGEEESAESSGNHEEVVRISRREGKEEGGGVKGRDAPGRTGGEGAPRWRNLEENVLTLPGPRQNGTSLPPSSDLTTRRRGRDLPAYYCREPRVLCPASAMTRGGSGARGRLWCGGGVQRAKAGRGGRGADTRD